MPNFSILVRMPNWLGDCVMAMPAVRFVADAFPAERIVLAGREPFREFFTMQNGVAGFLPAPASGLANLLRGIAAAKRSASHFTRAAGLPPIRAGLLLTNSVSTALWLRAVGAAARIGYATDARRLLLTRAVPFGPAEAALHCVESYLHLARQLPPGAPSAQAALSSAPSPGAAPAGAEPQVPSIAVNTETCAAAGRLLASLGLEEDSPYAVLAPASAYGAVKDWPPAHYRTLAAELTKSGLAVVITGSAGQTEVCRAVAEGLPGAVSVAGRTGLTDFLGLLAGSALFVGGDSGGAHAAGALGVPTVVIFGITNPVRTRPLGRRVRLVGAGDETNVDLSTAAARARAAELLAGIRPETVLAAAQAAMRMGLDAIP